ncbi:amidohydrolase [Myxococcota bacterium]|nr:amidohydrolase [Myxococcota bacterium]
MRYGHKIVDVDSHVMEPDDLWERYLDAPYRAYAPRTTRLSVEQLTYFCRIEVGGHVWFGQKGEWDRPFIDDGRGGRTTYKQAYREYIELDYSPEAYLLYMDRTGLDYAFLYPTLALHCTAIPNLDPKAAAGIKRAYNNWLYDFCNEGQGRLMGVGQIDLRDVDLARAEARRCVNELGFKSVEILPDPPIEGVPLDHPYYDPLWAEIADLGVPLGTHEASFHKMGSVGYVGAKHVNNTRIPYAPNLLAFGLGQMVGALMFTGSICARHPGLRVIFTESSVGWSATWLQFLDEKWEHSVRSGAGGPGLPEHPPSHYFREQCFISGGLDDPGQPHALLAGLEGNLLLATDFPHPEDVQGWRVLDAFDASPDSALDADQVKRICWDNPAHLYGLT